MRKYGFLLIALVFGLPFIGLTDFFPLHRYGMFARLAESDAGTPGKYSIEIHLGGQWQTLAAGNDYLDRNYFPLLAERAFGNPFREAELVAKLKASQKVQPDSIRLTEVKSTHSPISIRLIFPPQ